MVTELRTVTADFDPATFPFGSADLSRTRRIGIQIVIRGRVGGSQDTDEVTLPPVPLELEIVPIPLPTVAALFRDAELAGNAVLLMVPNGSPFTAAGSLVPTISALTNLLGTVRDAATATTWATGTNGLYSAVASLASRVPVTRHVGFLTRGSYSDLHDYEFIERRWWANTDLEDRASSGLLVSAERTISFLQDDGFGGR
ncbi:hypothetical protein [Streptomyces sp. NPDC057686]|uniref:hypothetical protein n=1 Tax=Streptomyces sp. NPDC057686 TaxID=3346212 RepID=UPI0036823C93